MIKGSFAKANKDSLNKLISSLKDNEKLKNYQIDENNVLFFMNYLENTEACEKCKSLDSCPYATKGYYARIVHENYYDLTYHECDFLKLEKKKQHLKNNAKYLYMNGINANILLKDYDISSPERMKKVEYLHHFISDYKNGKIDKGLFLCGRFGTGKTYLLTCFANELALNNIKSIMVYFPDLVRNLKSSISNNTLEERINELKNIDILILDDFGAELMTPWIRDDVFSPIINYRYQQNLPIFISSNVDFDDLTLNLSCGETKTINESKALRIIDRIKAMVIRSSLDKRFR